MWWIDSPRRVAEICQATTYDGRGTMQSTWMSKVDRLLPKMPVRLGPMVKGIAEGASIGGRAVPRLRDQRVEDNAFHLKTGNSRDASRVPKSPLCASLIF